MSLAIPKKKKIIIIIIVAATQVQADLDNNINDTVWETLMSQLAQADALLFSVPENEWTTAHEEAWAAVEDIHDAVNPEVPLENQPDWQSLSDHLGDKLAGL
jgi:hypothetical protein